MTTGAVAIAEEAALRVSGARDTGTLRPAVRHFRHVLSAMPDETFGPVSAEGARRLQTLVDGVIECIERQIAKGARGSDAQVLTEDVYRIRALMEEVGRSQHYASGRFK